MVGGIDVMDISCGLHEELMNDFRDKIEENYPKIYQLMHKKTINQILTSTGYNTNFVSHISILMGDERDEFFNYLKENEEEIVIKLAIKSFDDVGGINLDVTKISIKPISHKLSNGFSVDNNGMIFKKE